MSILLWRRFTNQADLLPRLFGSFLRRQSNSSVYRLSRELYLVWRRHGVVLIDIFDVLQRCNMETLLQPIFLYISITSITRQDGTKLPVIYLFTLLFPKALFAFRWVWLRCPTLLRWLFSHSVCRELVAHLRSCLGQCASNCWVVAPFERWFHQSLPEWIWKVINIAWDLCSINGWIVWNCTTIEHVQFSSFSWWQIIRQSYLYLMLFLLIHVLLIILTHNHCLISL